jgi:predicted GIY-YIG superfamily endonuclease
METGRVKDWVVYWIHLPTHTDIYEQGYVGYSGSFTRRMNSHSIELTARIGIDWEDLEVTKIATFSSKKDAAAYERVLRYKPLMAWNIAKGGGGGGMEGQKHSEGARAKMRVAKLGKKHTDEARANMSAALMGKTGTRGRAYKGAMIGTDPETGEILHRFEGMAAANAAGFNDGHISDVINGNRKTHKGCHWTRGAIT